MLLRSHGTIAATGELPEFDLTLGGRVWVALRQSHLAHLCLLCWPLDGSLLLVAKARRPQTRLLAMQQYHRSLRRTQRAHSLRVVVRRMAEVTLGVQLSSVFLVLMLREK